MASERGTRSTAGKAGAQAKKERLIAALNSLDKQLRDLRKTRVVQVALDPETYKCICTLTATCRFLRGGKGRNNAAILERCSDVTLARKAQAMRDQMETLRLEIEDWGEALRAVAVRYVAMMNRRTVVARKVARSERRR